MKFQTIAVKTVTIDETTYVQNATIINRTFAQAGFKFNNRFDGENMIYTMPATVRDSHIEKVMTDIINEILEAEAAE